MPKVSVIIPVYGVEKYIERCARSLFEQTLDDIEFIFVDDCSPDHSMEILGRIVGEYQSRIEEMGYNVRIECMPTNSGQAAVRRHGIQLATGDYITFCDSDDLMPINAVETLYDLAIESGADVASGDMEMLYADGTTKLCSINLPYGGDCEGVCRALLSRAYTHTLWSKLFKKSLLQEYDYITLMHATNGEDGMLFYQVLPHVDNVVHTNKVVYWYYQNTQSSTHVKLAEHGLNSIIQLNKIRLRTCCKFDSLKKETWIYISTVLNELIGDGYNKDGTLKDILKKEGMYEFINPFIMFMHFPICIYSKTMLRRVIKPYINRFKWIY